MKGAVITALLGLCIALAAGKQNSVLKEFDPAKFSGLWYEIAFASKLQGSPLKMRKMGAVLVELEGGHLVLTTSYNNEDRCVREKSTAWRGDVPGKFKLPKESGSKEVSVLATDYETYAIMDVVLHQGGMSRSVLKLYSRVLEHNQEALKSFYQVAEEYGLSAKDVYLLTRDMTCVNLLQSGGAPSS